jgi:NAD(P)-dependent dehydrogenase (short-subunit alcohol dehydrogenase family)
MSKGIALVTGGTKGIGKALCLRLKDAGYLVFSASRSKSLPQGMDGITQISADFSNSDETRSFAEKFLADYGAPDVFVNNAGYGAFYEWSEFPDEEITHQTQVLFSSPVELCRIFAPAMAEQSRGVIVNLSSLATLYPLPYMPMYNAGKSALSSFTESMMLEYHDFPKFIDFRMGDVHTDFNQSANRQENLIQSMKSAWDQIEKQLNESISVDSAVSQILTRIRNGTSGIFFGGTLFHRTVLPLAHRLLPTNLRLLFIRKWYRV